MIEALGSLGVQTPRVIGLAGPVRFEHYVN